MSVQIPTELIELWDGLADYPASRTDQSLGYLLHTVSDWIQADKAYWVGAIRMRTNRKDSIDGWRPRAMIYMNADQRNKALYDYAMKALDAEVPAETIKHHVKNAGKFRVYTKLEIASEDYLNSDYHRNKQKIQYESDVLYVVAPINRDAEAYFVFSRADGRFSEQDQATAVAAFQGLKWFFRRLMLHHGLMLADTPLTSTERLVLSHLVTDLSEKQIAEKLNKKSDVTHQHVKSIYRKFNVNSRAALMAIWLGVVPEAK